MAYPMLPPINRTERLIAVMVAITSSGDMIVMMTAAGRMTPMLSNQLEREHAPDSEPAQNAESDSYLPISLVYDSECAHSGSHETTRVISTGDLGSYVETKRISRAAP